VIGGNDQPRPTGPGWDDWWMWFGTVTGMVALATLALPVAIGVACAMVRARVARGSATGPAWRRSVAEVGLVCGTLPGVWLTMLPGGPPGPGVVSLVPLRDLATMSTFQIVGNLMLLAALGLFAPVRWSALATLPRIALLAGACSTTIEVAQHVLRLDRVSSVDDILLNAAGATMAAILSRPWWAHHRRATAARQQQPSVAST